MQGKSRRLRRGGCHRKCRADSGPGPARTGAGLLEVVPDLESYATLSAEDVAQVPGFERDAETLETTDDQVLIREEISNSKQ